MSRIEKRIANGEPLIYPREVLFLGFLSTTMIVISILSSVILAQNYFSLVQLITALTPVLGAEDSSSICVRFTRKNYRDAQCCICPLEGEVCNHTDRHIRSAHDMSPLAEQLNHE